MSIAEAERQKLSADAEKWLSENDPDGCKRGVRNNPSVKPLTEQDLFRRSIHIYTDGACEPNPGAGGWAFVVYECGVEITNRNGGDLETTNNIQEMTGLLAALEYCVIAKFKPEDVIIHCDSQYCVRGVNEWRHGWARKGWRRGEKPLANEGMWRAIAAAHDAFNCAVVWVRGHSGVPGNERADQLADKGRRYVLGER